MRQGNRWLLPGLALIGAFVGAWSMYGDQVGGWRFLAIGWVVGVVGALAVGWAIDRLKLVWSRTTRRQRTAAVGAGCGILLIATVVDNRGKLDEVFNDVLMVFCLLFGLFLWRMHQVLSRFLDTIWQRLKRR